MTERSPWAAPETQPIRTIEEQLEDDLRNDTDPDRMKKIIGGSDRETEKLYKPGAINIGDTFLVKRSESSGGGIEEWAVDVNEKGIKVLSTVTEDGTVLDKPITSTNMSPERQAELRQALEQQQRISEARDAVEAVHKIEVTEEYEDPEDMKVTVNLPKYSGITPSYTPSASVNSPSPREPFTPDAQDIPRKITYIDPKQEPSKAWNK